MIRKKQLLLNFRYTSSKSDHSLITELLFMRNENLPDKYDTKTKTKKDVYSSFKN